MEQEISNFHLDRSNAFADGCYCSVQIVTAFMKERWERSIDGILPKDETGYKDQCIKGLYLRAMALMMSLEKLSNAVHSQLIISANRSLLEIAVDLILLHDDKTNHSGWKMYWWGQSERLMACEQTIEFFGNKDLPEEYESRADFVAREKANIDHMRRSLWPKDNKAVHPRRWTNKTLKEDIGRADELLGFDVRDEIGKSLKELYCTEYRYMSWFSHSGISSVWGLPAEHFNLASGFAYLTSASLGMLCVKIVLKDFGLTDQIPELREKWENLNLLRRQSLKHKIEGFEND